MNYTFIKERNIFVCILLTFVTCGIYGIYWFCSLVSTVYALDERTESVGVEILLCFVTCGIYFLFVLHKLGVSLNNISQKNNIPSSSSSVLFIVLAIFGLTIVDYCIIQEELNTLARYSRNAATPVIENNYSNNTQTYTNNEPTNNNTSDDNNSEL